MSDDVVITIAGLVGTTLVGCVGFIWGRVYNHEMRLVRLETEHANLAGDIGEIKADVKQLCETIARADL